MALFHLSVTQTKRSAGQSAIASAAYRAGERLYSEYYGEYPYFYPKQQGHLCQSVWRTEHTMVDKFSQVAGNVPVTNNDPNRRYTVINGYPVVLNFAKEPNPGVFERVRDILLATSYTKKTS